MHNIKAIPIGGNGARRFVEKYDPLLLEGYRVDFSRDVRLHPPIYHFIITEEGSREILMWSQCRSLEEARTEASSYIKGYFGGRRDVAEAGGG